MLLEINPDNPQPRLIRQVADMLQSGAIICYPTDTVYGIGCDIFNPKAVKKIYQLKHRPTNKPFSFICSDLKDVNRFGHVSNLAYRLMKKNLPGPYTFVLPASKLVPKIMMTKQKTVGIRVPDNRISLDLIAALGNPILNTSAILDEEGTPPSEAFEIEELFGNRVDVVIDGGRIYPDPSTVVSIIGEDVEVLRHGKGEPEQFVL